MNHEPLNELESQELIKQSLHRGIPRKYHPKRFELLFEDKFVLVGIKERGILSVAAPYERHETVLHHLTAYVRKGNPKSYKKVFPVHRLDRETSGVMVFAKTYEIQQAIKEHWSEGEKIYYAVVYGHLRQPKGDIKSYLAEDEDYVVSSQGHANKGKIAHTQYELVSVSAHYSLVKLHLLTGRKNQLRVHLSELGNPIVGDIKYGTDIVNKSHRQLALHAAVLKFYHPVLKKFLMFKAPIPAFFDTYVGKINREV